MAVETVIHTLRHGHTAYNAEKRYAGTIDVPLSDKGIEDCRQAALRLAGRRFDVVVTSVKTRALETARLLVGDAVPILSTPVCNERCFGIMEGHTWEEVLKFDPPILLIEVGGDLHTVDPQGGEPFEDVWERAKAFRRLLFEEHAGRSILVVSHGVFLQMFNGLLRGLSCIPSLARFPATMEMARFRFVDGRMIEETSERLTGPVQEAKF
jgi:broad specificity phosphatase PhoE